MGGEEGEGDGRRDGMGPWEDLWSGMEWVGRWEPGT